MNKIVIVAAALAIACAALSTTASAQSGKCDPTITVNGKTVHIVEGLPPGKCSFTRTIILKGRDCPSGIAKAEAPSAEALRRHPVKAGEDAMYHFVCLPEAAPQQAPAPATQGRQLTIPVQL